VFLLLKSKWFIFKYYQKLTIVSEELRVQDLETECFYAFTFFDVNFSHFLLFDIYHFSFLSLHYVFGTLCIDIVLGIGIFSWVLVFADDILTGALRIL